MPIALDHEENKVSREMLPLPKPLAYASSGPLFTGRIGDLSSGYAIECALRDACLQEDLEKIKETLEKHNIGLKATISFIGRRGTLLDVAIFLQKPRVAKFLLNEIQVTRFGTEIAGLCFAKLKRPDKESCARISSNIASFLFASNSLISQTSFSAGADMEYQRLAKQFPVPEPAHVMPIPRAPRTLLFMGNFENLTRNFENLPKPVVDETAWQQWESTYYDEDNYPSRKAQPGYGPGAISTVVYKPKP